MSETKNNPRPLPQTSRTRAPLSSARSIFARSNTLETRFRSLAKVTEPSYGGVFDKVQRFFKTKSDEQLEKVQKSNIDTVTVISGLVDNQNNLIKQITDELKNDDEFNPEEFFRRLRGGPISGSGKRNGAARIKARERLARQRAAKAPKGLGTIGKTINRAMTAVGVGLGAAEEFNRSRDVGRAALVGGGILGGMLAGGAIGGFAGPLGGIAGSIIGGIVGEDRTRAVIESIVNPSVEALERGRTAIQQGAGGPMVQQQVSRGNLTEELRELVRTNVITRNQANELNRGLLSGVSVEQTRQRLEQIKTENRRRQQQSSIEGLATLASFNGDTYNDAIPVDENIIDVLMQTEFQELNFEADKIEFDGKLSAKQDASSITSPTASGMIGSYINPISTGVVGGFSGGIQGPSVDSGTGQQIQTDGNMQQPLYQQGSERQGGTPQVATSMERPGVTQRMEQTGSGSAQEAFNFFVSRGWTREQAAGIVGNLSVETGGTFNPNALNEAENAYGIAQWRGSRRTDFERWAGRPIVGSSFQQQLEFIQYELTQGNERNAGNRLRQAGTVVEATEIVDRYYERSSGAAIQQRINDANAIISGTGLVAAGTDMVAGDQAQRRTGQQIIMIPGQPGAGQTQQTMIPNQTHRGEVPLRIRFERQVA